MSLDELRQGIDELDGRLVELLNRRADLAARIGEEKQRGGIPVQDPTREAEVIARLRGLCRGALTGEAVERIYREIIAACSDIQKRGPDEDVQ